MRRTPANQLPGADNPTERYVYCARPRCPACRGAALLTYRSQSDGDGTVTRYSCCRTCGAKFIVVME